MLTYTVIIGVVGKMKTLLFILVVSFLFTLEVSAQVYDDPIDSTTHYNLRQYAQSAQVPAEILNEDKSIIDSVLYSLITTADSLDFVLVSDTSYSTEFLVLKISNYANGWSSFSGTNTTDTFTVSGGGLDSATTLFWLQPNGTAITSNDVLVYNVLTDSTVIVTRPASGTSGLKYTWRIIRRY